MQDSLLLQLSNGIDVVNAVIETQMPLAKRLAWRFMLANRNKMDDIKSVSLVGLVNGVNYIYNHPEEEYLPDNIPAFLNTVIRSYIIDFLNDDQFIPIPRRSILRAAEAGTPIHRPRVWTLYGTGNETEYEIEDNSYMEQLLEKELREEYDKMLSSTEHNILELRLRGHTQTEIAESMGCSLAWINTLMGDMREKFSLCQERQHTLS